MVRTILLGVVIVRRTAPKGEIGLGHQLGRGGRVSQTAQLCMYAAKRAVSAALLSAHICQTYPD